MTPFLFPAGKANSEHGFSWQQQFPSRNPTADGLRPGSDSRYGTAPGCPTWRSVLPLRSCPRSSSQSLCFPLCVRVPRRDAEWAKAKGVAIQGAKQE